MLSKSFFKGVMIFLAGTFACSIPIITTIHIIKSKSKGKGKGKGNNYISTHMPSLEPSTRPTTEPSPENRLICPPFGEDQVPISPLSQLKKCSSTETQCDLTVEIECTYFIDGKLTSCINDNDAAFTSLKDDECAIIDNINITYKMCNKNCVQFIPNANTRLALEKQANDGMMMPSDWLDPLDPDECRELEISLNNTQLCDEKVLMIIMTGQLEQQEVKSNYCECSLEKKSWVDVIESPSAYPSAAPSKSCDFENVAITELADPFDTENGQMIELTFLDEDCKNRTVTEPIALLFDSSTSSTKLLRKPLLGQGSTLMDLRGAQINRFGVLVVCDSRGPYNNCGFESPTGTFPPPDVAVCICSGPPASCNIQDQYGVGDCSGSRRTMKRKLQNSTVNDDDYSTGQAQRIRLNKPEDRGLYIRENWEIRKNVSVEEIKKSAGIWNPQYNISVVITEVFELQNLFFVELFALDEKDRGAIYSDEMKLIRFANGRKDPDWESAIPLNYIPDNGFILICNKSAKTTEYYWWAEICTIFIDDSLVNNETDAFAVVNGFEDLGYSVRDTVGSSGGNSEGTGFVGKRFERKTEFVTPSATFLRDWWTISDGDFFNVNPGRWQFISDNFNW